MIIYEDSKLILFQSGLYQTNSLIYNADSFVLLVDPNWLAEEVQEIRDYVNRNFKDKPIYLLFTHSDYDHIIAYGLFPEAKVIASERFQNKTDKEKIIEEIHLFDQQHYIKRTYPIVYPEVDIVISRDGQQLEIGEERFAFYHSPGHTDDGLFTIIESAGIFIAGDYLSDLEFPFIYYNGLEYKKTLSKVDFILQNHIISFLIPGHGKYLKDQNQEILARRDRDLEYIEELHDSILNEKPFPLKEWTSKFPFPEGLKAEHLKNEKSEVRNLK